MLPDAENRMVYGKCNNPYGHGHDYMLEVTASGKPDPVTGRLLPLTLLDELVRRVILTPMDRRDLNSEIDEFAGLVPTTENLAIVVARRLESAWLHALPGAAARLDKIRIHETKNNIFQISVLNPALGASSESEALSRQSKVLELQSLPARTANKESGFLSASPKDFHAQAANEESGFLSASPKDFHAQAANEVSGFLSALSKEQASGQRVTEP